MNELFDKQPQRLVRKNARLVDSWVWPKQVEEFVRTKVLGYTLNIPCGASVLGDVLADAEPRRAGVIKCDMAALPFADESFDCVISDPPWKIGYFQRWKPFLEAVRVTKVGGRIIYNATWIPWSRQVVLEEVVIRQDEYYTTCSNISIFKRTTNISPGWEPKRDKQMRLFQRR